MMPSVGPLLGVKLDPGEARRPTPGLVFDMADPTGWKMTSVRWLNENERYYVEGVQKSAHEMLERAMRRMNYLAADAEALMRSEPDKWASGPEAYAVQLNKLQGRLIDSVLSAWDAQEHARMLAFIAEGGLESRRRALGLGTSEKIGPINLGTESRAVKKLKASGTKAKPPVLEQTDEEIIDAEEKSAPGVAW